ncbi:MAG TPA: hypothetical protein VGJ00_00835 [Rhabdochlamydiaceae bacterium]
MIYFEVKELLQLLLENGETDLCRQYASLRTVQRHIIQKEKGGAIKTMEEFQIEIYTFAPSVEKAVQALKVIHWDQFHNPAVMWWYFEYALWCWNTSEAYFENPCELWIKQNPHFFQAWNQKETWREIVCVRNGVQQDQPIIFTSEFFKEGMKTLINAILAFAAKGFRLEIDNADPLQKMLFELKLEENQLWVFVNDHTLGPKRYYLKRLNDGSDKSCPYEFIEQLLKEYPNGGDVEVNLPNKSDSIPKAIDRLGLPKSLQRIFFGVSRGTSVYFRGISVAINRDERCRLILEELANVHNQAGAPEYVESLFTSAFDS